MASDPKLSHFIELDRRQLLSRAALGAAGTLVLGYESMFAREATAGWKTISHTPAYEFKDRVPDRRRFTFQFHDAVHSSGKAGVVVSVLRPNRPPARTVLGPDELVVYTDAAIAGYQRSAMAGFQKSFFGDLIGWAGDVVAAIKKAGAWAKDVWEAAKKVGQAWSALVEAILTLLDKASGGQFHLDFFAKSKAALGSDAVLTHMRHISESPVTGTAAYRVGLAAHRTLEWDKSGKLTTEFALTILSK